MASTKTFLDAVKDRRSVYKLTNESTISNDKIKELVEYAITHAPSSFNVQSARAIIVLKEQHEKLWDKGYELMKAVVPEAAFAGHIAPRIKMFHDAYGSVLFFEDETDLTALSQKNPMVAALVPEWSDHSSGMNQFILWTAFEAEGLGCNLQHYNLNPNFSKYVLEEFKLPDTWKLKSQLVFGTPAAPAGEKTYKPLEDRVKIFA